MPKNGFLKRQGIVRHAIRDDLLQFAIPAIIVFFFELLFCAHDGLHGIWRTVGRVLSQPQHLAKLSRASLFGLGLFLFGLSLMIVGQVTLHRNYSGTVAIRKNHQLITHGIYRLTRNPIYMGLIMAIMGIPLFAESLNGFLTSLVLIPIILNRIRLEEKLLTEEFQEAFRQYKKTTKKLIPFIY